MLTSKPCHDIFVVPRLAFTVKMKKKNDNGERILTTSRKARYDYSIIETIVVDHDKAEFCGRYCTNLLDPKERKREDCRFFDCVGKKCNPELLD